jgi:hypothetical protein
LINSRGSHAENNAQQNDRHCLAYSLPARECSDIPSHYGLLLITREMASSPFLEPRGDISGMIFPDFQGQVEIGAEKSAAKLRALS